MQRNGTHNYYICIGDPTHQHPIIQARIPAPIADRRVDRCYHLARHHQILIEHLCDNRRWEENVVPPLIEENEYVPAVEEENQEEP
jgi:hypothetical protein